MLFVFCCLYIFRGFLKKNVFAYRRYRGSRVLIVCIVNNERILFELKLKTGTVKTVRFWAIRIARQGVLYPVGRHFCLFIY